MDGTHSPSAAARGPNGYQAQGIRGWRVLVVEDDPDTAGLMAAMLRGDGCTVHVALDGLEALRAAEQEHPEVILLDLGLPGMSGYDVARGLRAQKTEKRPLLIAVTGRGEHADRLRSYEVGIDLHLTKPVDIEELRVYLNRFQTMSAHPGQ